MIALFNESTRKAEALSPRGGEQNIIGLYKRSNASEGYWSMESSQVGASRAAAARSRFR